MWLQRSLAGLLVGASLYYLLFHIGYYSEVTKNQYRQMAQHLGARLLAAEALAMGIRP